MWITHQADYALRALIFLAGFAPGERAATSEIADQTRIPPSFLAKIVSQLSVSGLIQTSRGAKGGVSLARPADEISVLEVIQAVDGPIHLTECTRSQRDCPFCPDCPGYKVFSEAESKVNDILGKATLASLVPSQPA